MHQKKQTTDSRRRIYFICFAAVFIWGFLLYAPTLHFPFQFDDDTQIVNNPGIRIHQLNYESLKQVLNGLSGHTRPVSMISFALNYAFGGYNPFGYRLVNVILHLFNGLLLYLILQNMLSARASTETIDADAHRWIALAATAIWIVHPLQTSSITLVVQRMNLLAAFFYLLSLLLYIRGRVQTNSIGSFIGSLLAGILALGSKEISVTLPFFIFLYEWFFFRELDYRWLEKQLRWVGPLILICGGVFLVLVIYGFFDKIMLNYRENWGFTPFQRLFTEFRVVVYYVSLFLLPLPSRLNLDHEFEISRSILTPLTTPLSLILILSMIFLAVRIAHKERIIAFAILWYFGNLCLESTIIPLDIIFEHRTYLPCLFLSVIPESLAWRYLRAKPYFWALCCVCIVLLSYGTWKRTLIWQTPVSLWEDAAEKSPNKYRPNINLGRSLAENGRYTEALKAYQKALDVNPSDDYLHYNMGAAYYAIGDIESAIAHYKKALDINPKFAEAYNNLGVCYIDRKKLDKGILLYKKALKYKPDYVNAEDNLKTALEGLHRINSKIKKIEARISVTPGDAETLAELALLYFHRGDFGRAEDLFQKALALDPSSKKALLGKAVMATTRGHLDTAISNFEKLSEAFPTSAVYDYNIACLYARQHKIAQAVDRLRSAVRKGYDDLEQIIKDKDLQTIHHTKFYRSLTEIKGNLHHGNDK